MRFHGRAVGHILVDGLVSAASFRVMAGISAGVAAVAVVQQTVNLFGADDGLLFGMLAGLLLGLMGGDRAVVSRPLAALYVLAVTALWPFWLGVLMDTVQALPTGVWQWPRTGDVVSFMAGLLSLSVPAAVLTRCVQDGSGSGIALLATSAGALLQLCVVASQWGLWLPACAVAALLVVLSLLQVAAGRETAGENPVPTPSSSAELRGIRSIVLTLASGLLIAEVVQLLSALWPTTAALWHTPWVAVVAGMGAGALWQRDPARGTAIVIGAMAALVLIVAPFLVEYSLWLNRTLTHAAVLEAGRLATVFAAVMPVGAVVGGHWSSVDRAKRKTAVREGPGPLVAGVMLAEIGAACGVNPLHGVTMAGLIACGVAIVVHRAAVNAAPNADTVGSRKLFPTSAVASAVASLVLAGGWLSAPAWTAAQPARLLFSTHALLAARTGWEVDLLPQLDDTRLLTHAAGRHGVWTLWQARGGEVQLRENGIPQGTLTTAPQWSPQYAPEVLPVVWPLVLLDQPARVLVLGARSGACLQAALVFPISEVVCHEPDANLVHLIRGPIAAKCGHDPFHDDRCRWVRQPEGWLAAIDEDPFDVIVSQPATAALQSCAEEFTVEFYRRAARRLSDRGVFCQRFSSVDFGPGPLLTAATALEAAFPETACLEIGTGEYLLLAAREADVLVRSDLPERLEASHVATLLARCQWDWSVALNLPAYDREALADAANELHVRPNAAAGGCLAFTAPRDMLRWGPKLQETAALLSKPRALSRDPVGSALVQDDPALPSGTQRHKSRKSRYLDWLGPAGEQPFILRRLAEVVGASQLVQQFPDTYWYEYRRELREELQKHPRSALDLVSHSDRWHPEDEQRKRYFEALGAATKEDRPSGRALQDLEDTLEPYDPLLTLFGHQEAAELYARGDRDPARELAHRLHVIYYAPAHDVSVRNVVAAIDHLVEHPNAIPNDAQRFDVLNGLLQTLRSRWEGRNQRPQKSLKVTLQEIDRSLVSVERAVAELEPLSVAAGNSPADWDARETVLDRLLLRPFRTYRDQLKLRARDSELKTRALLERAVGTDQ